MINYILEVTAIQTFFIRVFFASLSEQRPYAKDTKFVISDFSLGNALQANLSIIFDLNKEECTYFSCAIIWILTRMLQDSQTKCHLVFQDIDIT